MIAVFWRDDEMTLKQSVGARALLILVLGLWPAMAAANVPMFFVFALTKITYWWSIPLAVAIEGAALRWLFGYAWTVALRASLIVNLVSLALGILLYPMIGMMLFPVLAPAVTGAFGYGQMVELIATAIGFALVDAAVEVITLNVMQAWGWERVTWRAAIWFFLANLVTAALLLAVIYAAATPPRIKTAELDTVFATYAEEIALMDRLLEEMPAQRSDEFSGFSSAWLDAKQAEAKPTAFAVLSVAVPGLAFGDVLRREMMQRSSELDAQAHRNGFRIDRLTIDGKVTAFGFEKTVWGEEIYKVTGQIWQR